MGQIATSLNRREDGKLPSQTVANPRGQPKVEGFPAEDAHIVTTLRSGRWIGEEVGDPDVPEYDSRMDPTVVDDQEEAGPDRNDEQQIQPNPIACIPTPPFPHALQGPPLVDRSADILEVFQQVKINIPLLDAIQ